MSVDVSDSLEFYSEKKEFTLSVYNKTKNWNGTLEWTDGIKQWSVWDGTTTLNSAKGELYLRGTNNTRISTGYTYQRFVLTGKNIQVFGKIETLLDYQTVKNGNIPAMDNSCFAYLFMDCKSLIRPPVFSSTSLSLYCYYGMFYNCISLNRPPVLPSTTLSAGCYYGMFYNCISLTTIPALPATSLQPSCYQDMFNGCKALRLYTTERDYDTEIRIPYSETGTTATFSLENMFANTGGDFTGTPSINTTYYLHYAENNISTLVTDRTQSDVNEYERLRSLGADGMTAEELQQWTDGLKGAYKETDFNRVSLAYNYLAKRLHDLGELPTFNIFRTNWQKNEVPLSYNLFALINSIKILKRRTEASGNIPNSFDALTYDGANNIEQILINIDAKISQMEEL